jgi:hypothetical protein
MAAITARKIRLARDQGSDPVQGALFPKVTVKISYTDTAAINNDPITAQIVRLIATTDVHVKFHDLADAKAATSDMLLKANQPEYFTLQGKQYISAIRDASNGDLFVTVVE